MNDATPSWGAGFAKAIAYKYPSAQQDFREWTIGDPGNLSLGKTHCVQVSSDTFIVSMVSQHGYGPSPKPRIRYLALRNCLEQLSDCALKMGASIHVPLIGTGFAGGNWSYIAELLDEAVVRKGIRTTVYVLPGSSIPSVTESADGISPGPRFQPRKSP